MSSKVYGELDFEKNCEMESEIKNHVDSEIDRKHN